MQTVTLKTIASCSSLIAAGAIAFSLSAASAKAQDDFGRGPAYDNGPPRESVEVYAPRYHARRGNLGGEIVDAAMSKEVYIGDLDLFSNWGVHRLRDRIRLAAQSMCYRLELKYPATTHDSPPCYQAAVSRGMEDADVIIARTRGYAER